MAYFSQIDSYQTYAGQDADFHYDYNGNSGGGQSFLGGQFLSNSILTSPVVLDGKTALFSICYRSIDGRNHSVRIDADNRYIYLITPRGQGNQNMKLGLQGKVRPSLLLPAFLMLPETCGINMANSLDVSPLVKNNYWLRSMWLSCSQGDDGTVLLTPRDFVFGGGRQKGPDGKPIGTAMFFKLDFERRINDILRLANSLDGLSSDICTEICYFRDIYCGQSDFDYEDANTRINCLMAATARQFPTQYSGYGDPLATLVQFAFRKDSQLTPGVNRRPMSEPRNLIFFGAPGTGKSYQLNRLAHNNFDEGHIRRVTFYPDYTYSQFVGSFRPYSEDGRIGYGYIPGPFLNTYLDASLHPHENYLLIIEEINRANPAAVFGDIFQLLDRDPSGASEYSMAVSEDMSACIAAHLDTVTNAEKETIEAYFDPDLDFEDFCNSTMRELSLPPNMFIWATMNNADQGVFPMDTAFKRRWDFRYMGIDQGDHEPMRAYDGSSIDDFTINISGRSVRWNSLRKAINALLRKTGVNEDKLLGPFFLSPSVLSDEPASDDSSQTVFSSAFKDKVLLYLYEDAGKMRRDRIFAKDGATYSELCRLFDDEGVGVFDLKEDDLVGVFADDYSDDADGE
ncbi:McrB family protein [Atopobiaceae bacterium HCP3S3_F7]